MTGAVSRVARHFSAPIRHRLRGEGYCAREVDAGITLMETIVAIMLLGIIMTSTTAFFITANRSTSDLRHKQVATELADDALEQTNSFNASNLLAGRDQVTENAQWQAAHASLAVGNPWSGVAPWLANTAEVWDTSASLPTNNGASCARTNSGGSTAPLCIPTVPVSQTLSGVTYLVNTYVGQCWQPVNATTCGITPPSGVPYFRVIAAVSWQAKSCPVGGCLYVSAQLQSSAAADPLFNVNQVANTNPPPHILTPTAPQSTKGAFVQVPIGASGGTGTYSGWTMTGAPPGLAIDSGSGQVNGSPTTAGTYSNVVISMSDAVGVTATTGSFTWIINPAPTITGPGTQTATINQPFSLTLAGTRGTSPYTWTASGLPTGLTLATGTNVISGTPTAAGSSSVTVTLTDAAGVLATSTFTLVVALPPTVATIAAQSWQAGTAISTVTASASRGSTPYSWSATGLPSGVTINATSGAITGTPTAGSAGTATVTVTDSQGGTGSTSFSWTLSSPLSIVNPGTQLSWPTEPDSLALTSTGGSQPIVLWIASGLPSGMSINTTTGVISGTPTSLGTTSVLVYARDSAGTLKSVSFNWTVKLRNGLVISVSGNCMDDSAGSTTTGNKISGYACNSQTNQQWTFQTNKTVTVALGGTNYCLSANGNTASALVSLAACNSSNAAQQWVSTPVTSTTYNIVNQQSARLCLDLPSPTAWMDIQTCNATAQRTWQLPS